MPSLIPGYEYDIFISYRQKDNKGDMWVSVFVEALKTELEATFKEDIYVYFDENPHDRLQETHNVDKSLEGKLKCLIFIPILSQTYCDPNSYAWQYELLAFNNVAKEDSFGRDVRLRSGNVASRILPIQIHDLDQEDIKLFEKETSSVLRAMDFVFKTSAGVNRPLKVNEDHPLDNLNKIFYADQINKVAHAIKEIIHGMKTKSAEVVKGEDQLKESFKEVREEKRKNDHGKPVRASKVKVLFILAIVALLIIAAVIAYPKILKQNTLEKLRSSGERISVAVMPFQNMTNDTLWNVWQEGIKDILVSFMSASEELNVRDPESVRSIIENEGLSDYTSITPSIARAISRKLEADVYINGNLKMAGNTLRLYAQLIDSKSAVVFKSFLTEGKNDEEKIFGLVDSLSVAIRDFLLVHELKRGYSAETQNVVFTYSPEAYRNFMQGEKLFSNRDYVSARKLFSQAIAIDSNMIVSLLYTSISYGNQGLYEQAKEWCIRAYNKREFIPIRVKLYTEWLYANFFETPYEEIISLKKLIAVDDQAPRPYYLLGLAYDGLYKYENAISAYEKNLEIKKKWGMKAGWIYDYTSLGEAYHKAEKYREEKKIYKKAGLEFPDDPELLYREAVLALCEGKANAANSLIEKYISVRKGSSTSEAVIATNLAGIYSEANLPDKAEKYYREALYLEPENPRRLYSIAYFLIDKDRNIDEGLQLIEKAQILNLDEFYYTDCKGWGLYKKGKYVEALRLLEKSWEMKPIYDHEVYLHLEAAKKAVAGQKNN
jgi:tetratricopeptide (TPR) repeat protein